MKFDAIKLSVIVLPEPLKRSKPTLLLLAVFPVSTLPEAPPRAKPEPLLLAVFPLKVLPEDKSSKKANPPMLLAVFPVSVLLELPLLRKKPPPTTPSPLAVFPVRMLLVEEKVRNPTPPPLNVFPVRLLPEPPWRTKPQRHALGPPTMLLAVFPERILLEESSRTKPSPVLVAVLLIIVFPEEDWTKKPVGKFVMLQFLTMTPVLALRRMPEIPTSAKALGPVTV